jgi:hypothetical protein
MWTVIAIVAVLDVVLAVAVGRRLERYAPRTLPAARG